MNQKLRTDYGYNLHLLQSVEIENDYLQMPVIKAIKDYPSQLIGFNYAKTAREKDRGVHFYLDDYQFERVWNQPEKYVDLLSQFDFVCAPDFSLYIDMPKPLQVYNTYRNRLLGAWWQYQGIKVIPTLSWSDKASFDFAFNGIEKGGVVTVSTVGIYRNIEACKLWCDGMSELIKRINPSAILVYGNPIDFDNRNVELIYFKNNNAERMKNIGR